MTRARLLSTSALALVLSSMVACGAPPPPAVPGPLGAPAATSPTSASPLPAPAEAAPTAQQVEAPPEPPKPAFALAFEVEGPLNVFPVGASAIVVTGRYDGEQTYVLDESGVRADQRFRAGIEAEPEAPAAFSLSSIVGDFPKLEASVNFPGDRDGVYIDFEWTGSAWKQLPRNKQGMSDWTERFSRAYYLGGILAYLPDSMYEVIDQAETTSGYRATIAHVQTRGRGPLPKLAPALAADKPGCVTRVERHFDFAKTADGALWGVGVLCGTKEGALAVERWAPKWKPSVAYVLPGGDNPTASGSPMSYGAASIHAVGDQVWVTGAVKTSSGAEQAYLARWSGGAFEDVSPEGSLALVEFALLGDGTAVFTDEARIWTRPKGGSWSSETLPAGPYSLTKAPNDALWVILTDGSVYRRKLGEAAFEQRVLPKSETGAPLLAQWVRFLSTGEALVVAEAAPGRADGGGLTAIVREGAVAAPVVTKAAATKVAFGTTRAITPSCDKPLAVLYKMSKVAPDDYDFPATRKALKGQLGFRGTEIFVAKDGGHRYLAARPPSVAVGRKLVERITSEVKGSKPQLLCGEPAEVVRPFKLDLGTGELVK